MRLPQPLPPCSHPPRSQRSIKSRFAVAGLCTSLTWIPSPPAVSAGSWTHKSLPGETQSAQPLYQALCLQGSIFTTPPRKRKAATFNRVFHMVSLSAPCVLGVPPCLGVFEEQGMLRGTGEDHCSL